MPLRRVSIDGRLGLTDHQAYRDLKEPEGWTFSSFRKILHPAARDRGGEKMSGVSTHGLGGTGEQEPIVLSDDWTKND